MALRLLFLVLVLQGCAQVEPLTGGASDTSAPVPKLNTAAPPMASVNVRPAEIRISFDEYITLKNAQANISVVPELTTKPEYKVRGRDLFILINTNELISNTTYSFLFNGAVADFTEGNDSTFTYVFSTGAKIDSLLYSAVVMDVLTQQPVNNAKVGLYTETETFNPYKSKPLYSAQSNKDGLAQFAYLSSQSFRVFAFSDDAQLSESSAVAFLNEAVQSDTSTIADTLWLYLPKSAPLKPRIIKKNGVLPGRIELVTNFDFILSDVLIYDKNEQVVKHDLEQSNRADSCVIWIAAEENSAYTAHVPYQDTVYTARINFKKLIDSKITYKSNIKEEELEISDTLTIAFNKPMVNIDSEKMLFIRDTDTLKNPRLDIHNLRNLRLLDSLVAGEMNNLVLLPQSIVFYDNSTNQDSILLNFKQKGENKYANLEIELENRPNLPLVIQLYQSNKLIEARSIDTIQTNLFFNLLKPGEYNVSVVLDENANGAWDSGSFFEKRQPEKILIFPQKITLRANWDTKQRVAFKQSKQL